MIKNTALITIIILCFLCALTGQENDTLTNAEAKEVITKDSLVVKVRVNSKGIHIDWFPTQPENWKAQLDKGYTVRRVEVDENGNELSDATVLGSNPILRKDSTWMANNKRIADGLLEPIMALMYDSTFIFPENDFLDETDMKFNYTVFEATENIEIASAVGLGITDTTAVDGKAYRYIITGVDADLTGQVDIDLSRSTYVQNPFPTPINFTFPNNISLSEMLSAARPKEVKEIYAIGKAYGDSIVIRWGPSTPRLWQTAMEDGYNIYRQSPSQPRELIKTVFPWPESQITEDIAHDSIALMAAGLLYNQVETNPEEEAALFEKAAAFENDFGFSLFAAERSGLAAQILGLGFVDTDVEPDSNYTYLIGTDGVITPLFWGKVDITNTFQETPKPLGFRAESKEKIIKLVWEKPENESRFSGYYLERSMDSINYQKLNTSPLVFSENDRFPLQQFSYTDTVGVNYKKFFYRLKGINSFGELSSNASTSGMARDFTPPAAVNISSATYNDSLKQFTINWNTVEPNPSDFSHYQVMLNDEPNGQFSSISTNISKDSAQFVFNVGDMDTDRGFFFKIQSQDTVGNFNLSLSKAAPVPDLIAPDPPEVITGIVDSTGKVTVAWEHSTAKDLTGYWLYWGNDPNQEMSLVNDDLLNINSHFWYIDDVSMNEKIYFCIRAQDDAYNKGRASKIIEVSRPDKVPPTTPFVLNASPVNGQIEINWQLSLSEDVEGQLLYRRLVSKLDTQWILMDTLSVFQNQYIDTDILIDQPYQYCFKNFDDADNVSDYSNVKTAKVPFPEEKAMVSDLEVKLKEENKTKANSLNWEYQPPNEQIANVNHTFQVYRSVGGENPKFIQSVDSDNRIFIDTEVVDGVLYNYAITIQYENGWKGKQSEIKSMLVR